MTYTGGIYSGEAGCGSGINHAVLVVGYGTDPATKTPFWLIKNSWGPGWGEGGYIRVRRGANTCGLVTYSPHSQQLLVHQPQIQIQHQSPTQPLPHQQVAAHLLTLS